MIMSCNVHVHSRGVYKKLHMSYLLTETDFLKLRKTVAVLKKNDDDDDIDRVCHQATLNGHGHECVAGFRLGLMLKERVTFM